MQKAPVCSFHIGMELKEAKIKIGNLKEAQLKCLGNVSV